LPFFGATHIPSSHLLLPSYQLLFPTLKARERGADEVEDCLFAGDFEGLSEGYFEGEVVGEEGGLVRGLEGKEGLAESAEVGVERGVEGLGLGRGVIRYHHLLPSSPLHLPQSPHHCLELPLRPPPLFQVFPQGLESLQHLLLRLQAAYRSLLKGALQQLQLVNRLRSGLLRGQGGLHVRGGFDGSGL
jgi:hypothetical protein